MNAGELAIEALYSPTGHKLAEYEARAILVTGLATSAEQARELGAAAAEAPDGGEGMAAAQFEELSEGQRQAVRNRAGERAGASCVEAANWLVAAAELLGVEVDEIDPTAVALMAAVLEALQAEARP